MKESLFEAEHVKVKDLRPHPRNYRSHPEDQIQHLKKSIEEHGLYRNVVIARDGTILAGHGVVKAAESLGYEEVPVYRMDVDPDDPQAYKVLIGDNEIEHLAMQDDRALSEMLKDIAEADDADLIGTGYDDQMLANLVYVSRDREEIEDFDEAEHWVGMPDYEEEDTAEPCKLVISFNTEEEREQFMEEVLDGEDPMVKSGKTWSMRWPPRGREDRSSLKFEPNGEANT